MDFTIVNQTTQNSNKKIQNFLELRCNNEGSPTYQDNIISDICFSLLTISCSIFRLKDLAIRIYISNDKGNPHCKPLVAIKNIVDYLFTKAATHRLLI